jgi:NTE family protein
MVRWLTARFEDFPQMNERFPSTQARQGWRPERCDRIALLLQGGGALGAYQGGVYEALWGSGLDIDWIAGVSIGAINSALIAGNPPERRVERLREFWNRITARKIWNHTPDGDIFRQMRNSQSAMLTMLLGQPGFFTPYLLNAWLSPAGSTTATSFYDSSPLRDTLLDLVDFDLINARQMRFAVGAVNIVSGNFLWFDNAHLEILPEHIMASAALPPSLPMIKIGTEYYWDGGIVSNTPLQHLLENEERMNSLVFQVDLFSARGDLPRDMPDVVSRRKDIMFSSRTRYTTDLYRRMQSIKLDLREALRRIPQEQRTEHDSRMLEELSDLAEITILHLIYQQKAYEGHAKDYEFSGTSMREHWSSGYDDTMMTLRQRDWITIPRDGGIVVHDVHRLAAGLR